MKKDFIESGKDPVCRTPWGNENYRPRFWPEETWPWKSISNPSKKQRVPIPKPLKLIHIMKQCVRNRLEMKGIYEMDHISDTYTVEQAKRKMLIRGYKKTDVPVNKYEFVNDTTLSEYVSEAETILNPNDYEVIKEEATETEHNIDMEEDAKNEDEAFNEEEMKILMMIHNFNSNKTQV